MLAIDKQIDEYPIKSLLDGYFGPSIGSTSLWSFLFYIRKQLRLLPNIISDYFNSAFKLSHSIFPIPTFEKQSNIISIEHLSLLYLGNNYVKNTANLRLLYSTLKTGFRFNDMVNSLVGYEGIIFIMLISN